MHAILSTWISNIFQQWKQIWVRNFSPNKNILILISLKQQLKTLLLTQAQTKQVIFFRISPRNSQMNVHRPHKKMSARQKAPCIPRRSLHLILSGTQQKHKIPSTLSLSLSGLTEIVKCEIIRQSLTNLGFKISLKWLTNLQD